MTALDFLQTPLAQPTTWWMDEETHDVMTRCETCGATARHTEEQLEAFEFQHSPTCVAGLEAGRALREKYAPGKTADAPAVEEAASNPDQVLLVKRELWDRVMDGLRDQVNAHVDYAAAARSLAEALRSGAAPSTTELDALVVHLTDVIDAHDLELSALSELRDGPRPAPQPADLSLHAPRSSSPVIASKGMWDNIAALTEGTFETADALLERLSELVVEVRAERPPDHGELEELSGALQETREALTEDRAMFERWMGDLAWVPTEV